MAAILPLNTGSRRKKDRTLSAEDASWATTVHDESALAPALAEVCHSLRTQTADSIPWVEQAWRLILPRGRHYVHVWKTRQPREQTASGQQRRSSDQYLVQLKKHFLDEIFTKLDGSILDHLRVEDDESDPIRRAATQKRRNALVDLSEIARREILRKELAQWMSNCTKSHKGPRWMQVYNKEYGRSLNSREPLKADEGDPEESTEDTIRNGSEVVTAEHGPLYQGRAHSAQELFAQTQPYKDTVMQCAARMIARDEDPPTDGKDIRHWRRALDQIWGETTESIRNDFLARAASFATRVNRGYQQVDRAFAQIVEGARAVQAIDDAFGAVVVETRKWSPSSNSWDTVRYVCTTIPSKCSKKLQHTFDFSAYDQNLTNWCDMARTERMQHSEAQMWVIEDPDHPVREDISIGHEATPKQDVPKHAEAMIGPEDGVAQSAGQGQRAALDSNTTADARPTAHAAAPASPEEDQNIRSSPHSLRLLAYDPDMEQQSHAIDSEGATRDAVMMAHTPSPNAGRERQVPAGSRGTLTDTGLVETDLASLHLPGPSMAAISTGRSDRDMNRGRRIAGLRAEKRKRMEIEQGESHEQEPIRRVTRRTEAPSLRRSSRTAVPKN